jgi:endonuclease-3
MAAKKKVVARKKKVPRKASGKKPAAKKASGGAAGTDPKRVRAILAGLDAAYPNATCELNYQSAFQLLIATILSAQCTDVRVNQVTAELFKKYKKPEDFAYASPAEMEKEIRPTGFFRNKTKSIMGASRALVEKFGGEVPRTMEEILTLPGVARKTGNVVLGTAYEIASGVVVDTHVMRLSERLDLTRNDDPKKIEQDLIKVIPQDRWIKFSHQIIWHGRRVCFARKPNCAACNLESLCYSKDKTV